MSRYGEYLSKDFSYFRSDVPRSTNLLALKPHEDAYDGALKSAYDFALERLQGLSNDCVFALLDVADMIVRDTIVDNPAAVRVNETDAVSADMLPCIRPTEIMPAILFALEKVDLHLQDLDGKLLRFTGERFCCAYILTQVWYAVICGAEDGAGYAIEAAKAQTIVKILDGDRSGLSRLVARRIGKNMAATGGKVRWQGDPKKAAMTAIQEEWRRRKDAGEKFKAVDFAREMHRRKEFRCVTLEAIKNAQTRWNKEYHPAS